VNKKNNHKNKGLCVKSHNEHMNPVSIEQVFRMMMACKIYFIKSILLNNENCIGSAKNIDFVAR